MAGNDATNDAEPTRGEPKPAGRTLAELSKKATIRKNGSRRRGPRPIRETPDIQKTP
jgi:hypothetical protein